MYESDKAQIDELAIHAIAAIKEAQEKMTAQAMWELPGAGTPEAPFGVASAVARAADAGNALRTATTQTLAAIGADEGAPPQLAFVDGIPTLPSVMAVWSDFKGKTAQI